MLFLCCLAGSLFSQKQSYLLAGTYTGGKSKGIYVYRFMQNGSAELVDSAITSNPSYLAVSPNKQFVYAVNELSAGEGGGRVSAYRFDKNTGKLSFLNDRSSEGEHPCYITTDAKNRWVIVGNYSSGNVTVLPVQDDGSLGEPLTTVQHYGRSISNRQEKPHVHATVLSADNRYVFVPDLGKDKVMIYAFDKSSGMLTPRDTTLKVHPGSGPRHFEFHPNNRWAYLLQELSGTVTAYRYRNGNLSAFQTISVLPKDFAASFTSADIHVSPDGRFLYTSTRDAANLLTVFSIDARKGLLKLQGHHSTEGKTPRNFTIDPSGNFLLAANQQSNNVVIFRRDRQTGKLANTGKRINIGNPVCLKWINP
jgi:6-phosphogluconolactonase